MITVRRNKANNGDQFPIVIQTNAGKFFYTERAAKELRDKLSSILAELKNRGKP